jgi:predicted amidohydrolase
MLSETARETGVWLIGGSIPECRAGEDKVWNTATVWDPQGE